MHGDSSLRNGRGNPGGTFRPPSVQTAGHNSRDETERMLRKRMKSVANVLYVRAAGKGRGCQKEGEHRFSEPAGNGGRHKKKCSEKGRLSKPRKKGPAEVIHGEEDRVGSRRNRYR